jgi:reverse gyrase
VIADCLNILEQSIRSILFLSRLNQFCLLTMSSTQEYKEARVQYWEQMLGFEYNTNSTKFRAFTACKALCDHVDATKASAAYYTTDYQICHSKPL